MTIKIVKTVTMMNLKLTSIMMMIMMMTKMKLIAIILQTMIIKGLSTIEVNSITTND